MNEAPHSSLFDLLVLQKIQSVTFMRASMAAHRVHCASGYYHLGVGCRWRTG